MGEVERMGRVGEWKSAKEWKSGRAGEWERERVGKSGRKNGRNSARKSGEYEW